MGISCEDCDRREPRICEKHGSPAGVVVDRKPPEGDVITLADVVERDFEFEEHEP
jgi:hypothetical protein